MTLRNHTRSNSNDNGPVLPNELWEQIALHLEDAEQQRLASLNSTFLEVALDSRYRSVTLFHFYPNRRYNSWLLCRHKNRLDRLQEPHISRRVQALKIDANELFKHNVSNYPADKHPDFQRQVRTIFNGIVIRRGPELSQLVLQVIRNLQNVESLTIIKPHYPSPLYGDFVSFVWNHFTQDIEPQHGRLRELQFIFFGGREDGPFLNLPSLEDNIRRFRTALAALERLYICISQLHEGHDDMIQQADFIGRMLQILAGSKETDIVSKNSSDSSRRSKLTCLDIFAVSSTYEPSGIVDQILSPWSTPSISSRKQAFLPNLTHCSISVNCLSTSVPTIEFLKAHRKTITHLRTSCHFYVPTSSELNDAQSMTVPNPINKWAIAPPMTQLTYLEIAEVRKVTMPVGLTEIDTLRSFVVQSCANGTGTTGIKTVVIDPLLILTLSDVIYLCRGTRSPLYGTAYPCPGPSALAIFQSALSSIERLSVTFLCLTPSHLTYIFSYFPNLRELHLIIHAKGYELPFRGSSYSHLEQEWQTRPSVIRGHGLPTEEWKRDNMYIAFQHELHNCLVGHAPANILPLQSDDYPQWGNSSGSLEELRICLNQVDDDVITKVRAQLADALPGVKRLIIGNSIWVYEGEFIGK